MAPRTWTRIIHVAKTKCGLDDEAYRALLQGAAGVESSSDISSQEQFASVMSCFKRLGFVSKGRVGRRWPCTWSQQKKILVLWKLAARHPTEPALEAFVRRIVNIESMDWLNNRLAQRVIIALSSLARQAGYDPETGRKLPIVEAAG
jgi:phage gp16-like protein